MEKKKLYVGCGLTHASEEFKQEVLRFRGALEEDFEVLKFVGISPETPAARVYEHDITCVTASDLLLGVCDEVSTGLGWEMGYGAALGKRILAVAHQDTHVTKMVIGAGESSLAPTVLFERYTNLADDVIPLIHQVFTQEVTLDSPASY